VWHSVSSILTLCCPRVESSQITQSWHDQSISPVSWKYAWLVAKFNITQTGRKVFHASTVCSTGRSRKQTDRTSRLTCRTHRRLSFDFSSTFSTSRRQVENLWYNIYELNLTWELVLRKQKKDFETQNNVCHSS